MASPQLHMSIDLLQPNNHDGKQLQHVSSQGIILRDMWVGKGAHLAMVNTNKKANCAFH